MARRSLPPAALAVLLVGLLVVCAAVPYGATGRAPFRGVSPARALGTVPLERAAAPAPLTEPIGGRLFTTATAAPDGASNSVTGLAVDPSNGEVFAANEFAGTVTEFSESTGALVNEVGVATFAAGAFPTGLAIDTTHHRLFVSISENYAGVRTGGWLLVLNESNLGTLANISFSSSPIAPFEPTYLAYDAPSDQVFVENQSWGDLAIVNLTSAPNLPSYLDCPVVDCAYHGYGLLDVAQYHTLVIPTCAQQLWFVNTTNDSTRATVTGPPDSLMAWAAFDTATNALWVENYTFLGPAGSFFRMNLTTLAIETNVPGAPPRGTDLAYDPVDNVLIATNLNGSEEIATYDASNASPIATFATGTGGVHPFLTLVVDPTTELAIASGPGNGTTIAFRLPSLTVADVYPSFPGAQPAVAVDNASGSYFVAGLNPTTVRAASESTGALQWSTLLPSGSDPVALATDAAAGDLFVADSGAGSVRTLDGTSGALDGNVSLPGGASPCSLLFDPTLDALFVGASNPGEVVQLDPASGAVVHTIAVAGAFPCGLSLDPVTGDVLVLSTGDPGLVDVLLPTTAAIAASYPIAASPRAIAVNATGVVFVLDSAGTGLSLLNGSTGASLGSDPIPGGSVTALALDDPDGFLFAAVSSSGTVDVLGTGSGQPLGSLLFPSPADSLAFDATSGVLVAPVTSGQVSTATLVPVPGAPTALVATAGNGTVDLSWSAPSSSGSYPTDGYVVAAHPPSGRPGGQLANATATSLVLDNLSDGEPYLVEVRAHSDAGLGIAPATAEVTPIGVPYPPTDLEVKTIGSSILTVTWSSPASDDGSNVTGYTVQFLAAGSATAIEVSAGTALSTQLTGLSAGTSYTVDVVAANSAGTGHASASATASTAAAPTAGFSSLDLALGILGAVVVVALVGGWAWRRRRPGSGSPTATTDAPGRPSPPDETP